MHAAHLTLTKAQEQNNAKINLCWVPGPLLPADINSKSIIGEFTSNKLWNQGPPLFWDNGIVNHIYGYYTNGQIMKNPNFKLQEPGAPDKPLNQAESQLVLFAQNKELAQELDTSFSIQQTLRHTHRLLWTEQDLGAKEIKNPLYQQLLNLKEDYFELIGIVAKILSHQLEHSHTK